MDYNFKIDNIFNSAHLHLVGGKLAFHFNDYLRRLIEVKYPHYVRNKKILDLLYDEENELFKLRGFAEKFTFFLRCKFDTSEPPTFFVFQNLDVQIDINNVALIEEISEQLANNIWSSLQKNEFIAAKSWHLTENGKIVPQIKGFLFENPTNEDKVILQKTTNLGELNFSTALDVTSAILMTFAEPLELWDAITSLKISHEFREKFLNASFYDRCIGHNTATAFVQCNENLSGFWV